MTSVVFISGRDPCKFPECSHGVFMRTHARAARAAGYRVHTACVGPSEETRETDFGWVHVARTSWKMIRQNRMPWFSPILARKAAAVVRSIGSEPSVVHGVGVWGHAGARALALLAESGMRAALVTTAYTTHVDETASQWRGLAAGSGWHMRAPLGFELLWSRALITRYEAVGHRRAQRVLVNYRSVQRLIEQRFGVTPEIVPYTTEQEFLSTVRPSASLPPRASGPVRILCIARNDPRKGIDVLLQALLQLKRTGVPFAAKLVGGGAFLEAYRHLCHALGLADCVEMLGIVPRVEPYLEEADIFVLPAREEQSGSLALIEAMRAGLACVASGCDGVPEDMRHKIDGWLTAPGDAGSLAEGLARLIADPALRRTLARAARRRFEERFSRAAMTAALDRVYRTVLAEAPAPASSKRGERAALSRA